MRLKLSNASLSKKCQWEKADSHKTLITEFLFNGSKINCVFPKLSLIKIKVTWHTFHQIAWFVISKGGDYDVFSWEINHLCSK